MANNNPFAIAARELAKTWERGRIRIVAQDMGIQATFLSDLFAGRRSWSEQKKEAFCKAVDIKMSEMYARGEDYIATGCFFPYGPEVSGTEPHSYERAFTIAMLAAQEAKLKGIPFIKDKEQLRILKDYDTDKYVKGELTDGEMLNYYRAIMSSILEYYRD